ncbi:ABC transporter permease [Halocella sp. SP3-1]|uniref:ABC transporter permease n=1 Tax=Halocella sp. SP3-1 TaxID=2382161 RepID=UPI000F764F7B|nr:ABC transporter permease [Halocella sp. SP3-1]AZO93136.1 ABC transporter permease [Halocella sp. SP3-1]
MSRKIRLFIIYILVMLFFHIITSGKFLILSNVRVVISHAIIPTFIVWALCFIFKADIMDLSLGAVMVVASTVAGFLGLKFGYLGLVSGGLITGLLLEYINCKVFSKLKIPSWVTGLAMAMIYESAAAYYSFLCVKNGQEIVHLGDKVRALGLIPYNIIFWFLGFVLAYILYNYTSIGLNIKAVGGNEEVSSKMGVNVEKAKVYAVLIGGIFIGLAGAINESYAGRVMPLTGLSSIALIFQPLAAFLMAQAMENTLNIVIGATIGAISISALFNTLTLLGVPSGTWQEVILGLSVVVIAGISQKNVRGVVK